MGLWNDDQFNGIERWPIWWPPQLPATAPQTQAVPPLEAPAMSPWLTTFRLARAVDWVWAAGGQPRGAL